MLSYCATHTRVNYTQATTHIHTHTYIPIHIHTHTHTCIHIHTDVTSVDKDGDGVVKWSEFLCDVIVKDYNVTTTDVENIRAKVCACVQECVCYF
jgi:hypothetical protein